MKKNLQLIERYSDGELNADEITAFEKRLAEDAAFLKAFQQEKELMQGIEEFGNQQLRKQLDVIHLEETGQVEIPDVKEPPSHFDPFEAPKADGKVVGMTRRYWWLAAAALGVGMVARWFMATNQPTPQQLYAIFAVHDFDFTEMGTNEELLAQSERLLKEKKYASALPIINQYLSANPDDVKVKMAKGIALLETGKYSEAQVVFETIGRENMIMENEANWYLALSFLKQGKITESKNQLLKIPKAAVNYERVKKLIQYLERQNR